MVLGMEDLLMFVLVSSTVESTDCYILGLTFAKRHASTLIQIFKRTAKRKLNKLWQTLDFGK